jgi:DNA-binding XRE family transcriptional regulator
MSQFAQQLKNEISRIARKELRTDQEKFKKVAAASRSDLTALKDRVSSLETQVKKLSKLLSTGALPAQKSSDVSPSLRFRADGFASLRKKFDLSAADMGKLLGVSAQSVYHWETGKSKPQAKQLAAIAAARSLGKKQVTAKLADTPQVRD